MSLVTAFEVNHGFWCTEYLLTITINDVPLNNFIILKCVSLTVNETSGNIPKQIDYVERLLKLNYFDTENKYLIHQSACNVVKNDYIISS